MAIQSNYSAYQGVNSNYKSKAAKETKAETETEQVTEKAEETAAKTSSQNKVQSESYKADMDAIKNAKSESKNNIGAFKQMIFQMIKTQGTGGNSSFAALAKSVGLLDMDQATAAANTAEGGEWGVEATANRILDMAKSLSGGDASKIETLKKAVSAGFNAAKKALGGSLPGISEQTYKRVMEGFDEWEKSAAAATSVAS